MDKDENTEVLKRDYKCINRQNKENEINTKMSEKCKRESTLDMYYISPVRFNPFSNLSNTQYGWAGT